VTGGKKLCGHEYECVCPGDRVKALLAKLEEK
jgi:hypothetical protein